MTHDEIGSAAEPPPEAMRQPAEGPPVPAPPAAVERVPYLGVYLGADLYGLPLPHLREVARLTRLRRMPGAPPSVAGLCNLRGEIVCALDARAILGLEPWTPSESAVVIALRGFGYPVGLLVDSVAEIVLVDPAQIEPLPATVPADRAACFQGTTSVRLGFIFLLDLEGIVTR